MIQDRIDRQKVNQLQLSWLKHEHWVQAGCPTDPPHELSVPGYVSVAGDAPEAYDYYRHSFVPFFADLEGFRGLFGDLTVLVSDLEQSFPEESAEMFDQFGTPDDTFKAQWGNLFDALSHDGLSHRTLQTYQRKFEIVLPLHFLTNAKQLLTEGTFDPQLNQFRNRTGQLTKGHLVSNLLSGFDDYPVLKDVLNQAYSTDLRNAIAHNSYVIEDNAVRSLDGKVELPGRSFLRSLNALQALQNGVLWLLMTRSDYDPGTLKAAGVVGVVWGWIEDHPHMSVLQLAPFFELHSGKLWFEEVELAEEGSELRTVLGDSQPTMGPVPDELEKLLEAARAIGRVHLEVVPVMPCVHDHTDFQGPHGEFCPTDEGVSQLVPIRWSA